MFRIEGLKYVVSLNRQFSHVVKIPDILNGACALVSSDRGGVKMGDVTVDLASRLGSCDVTGERGVAFQW